METTGRTTTGEERNGTVPAVAASRLHVADIGRTASVGLRTRKLRAALSALGIMIGIAAVVGVLGLSESSKSDLLAQLERLGTNLLTVQAGTGIGIGSGELPADAAAMIARVGPVETTSTISDVDDARVYRSDLIPPGQTSGITVEAVDINLLDTLAGTVADGRFLDDATRSFPTTVLGSVAAGRHVAETQELEARIDVDRDDEVGRLAASFHAMLTALEESREQQHRLVYDAGHELRTPLTALRTNIELLARADDLPEEQRRGLLDDITFELKELSNLVTEVIDLATDAATTDEPVIALALGELVERAVERARRRTGREIETELEPHQIQGRRVMLERAVANLLDNAAKWSPADGRVEVTLSGSRLEVRDHGPGIAEVDLPRLFDRFYRAKARRGAPGSGLGLSIVKRIVEEHDGTVFAERAEDGGAIVGFELPVDRETASQD